MRKFTLIAFAFLVLFSSCGDKNEPTERQMADAQTRKVNDFIKGVMDFSYLWHETMPQIDNRYETNSIEYFLKMLHEDDGYSAITNDIESYLESNNGVDKSFGFSLTFLYANEQKTQCYAIVDYIYPNSPASNAGIKRGDIIVSLNNRNIRDNDIKDFYTKSSITIEVGQVTAEKAIINVVTKNLSSVVLTQNPVHTRRIIEKDGKKIGYLFYTSFITNFNPSLDEAFAFFKAEGVTEFILDLRYNLGGNINAIINLCSHLAPRINVENQDIIIKNRYNKLLEAYYKENEVNLNNYFDKKYLPNNLNLNKLYILVSDMSISASEVTILGLKPYMDDVICIGSRTGGKYLGSTLFQPFIGEDKLDPDIKNWGIMPIICEYVNNNNESAKGGIIPQYEVSRMIFPLVELTDDKEPMIDLALQLIAGTPLNRATKSTVSSFEIVPGIHNPSDKIKQNLIFIK